MKPHERLQSLISEFCLKYWAVVDINGESVIIMSDIGYAKEQLRKMEDMIKAVEEVEKEEAKKDQQEEK